MIMFDPSTVAAIVLKTSLLVVAIGLIALLMARKSAAWRHFLWTAALALSLLMPIAAVYLPSWVQVSLPWETAEPWPRDETALVTADVRHADAESVVPGPRHDELSAAPREVRAAWPTAMIVWLIGALGVLLRNALAHVGLIRWVRKSRPDLSPAWAATLRAAASEAGFRRRVRVLESDHTTSPCTFGLVRPVVLLPAAGAGWPEAQRRFTLLHELAHVRRLDYLTTQVSSMACAVHWCNPLVWFAAIQARKLQEQACDDVVLNAGGTPSDYAQFLVGLAGGSRRLSPAFPAAVGMVQRSQLHGRVTAILDASRARLPLGGLALVTALAPLAGLMLFLATLSAAATPLAMQPGVPLTASFSSVELRNGGKVSLVHGQSQGVTLLKGDPDQASITIRDNGRLVIDRCPTHCPRNHDFEVEVVTPALSAIAVAEGGTIQARGDFPPQSEIGVGVSQGGTIDIRSMPVANVTASVFSGGRIFTRPGAALSAKVEQGGNITYWGDALVNSSIQYGGVVVDGRPSDADKSLAELMGPVYVEPPAPVPPVSPVSRIQPTRR
jgi:beta-lactamase regulating signal transducer with metallopeptidase domain